MAYVRYSKDERVLMVKLYYRFQNAEEVLRQWQNFSAIPKPDRRTVTRLVRKFEESGSVADAPGRGDIATVCTEELHESIVTSLIRSPQKSSRRLSAELGVSQTSIIRCLHNMGFKPFRPRLIHGLTDEDPSLRVIFSETFLGIVEDDETVLNRIIWSDEATFKLNGHINRYNCIYWDSENDN